MPLCTETEPAEKWTTHSHVCCGTRKWTIGGEHVRRPSESVIQKTARKLHSIPTRFHDPVKIIQVYFCHLNIIAKIGAFFFKNLLLSLLSQASNEHFRLQSESSGMISAVNLSLNIHPDYEFVSLWHFLKAQSSQIRFSVKCQHIGYEISLRHWCSPQDGLF